MKTTNSKTKVEWEGRLTSIQCNILSSLSIYGYLTLKQLLSIGVGVSHYQYLWRQIVSLRDRRKPLVKCHNYNVQLPHRGRLESLYFLTNHGRKALIEDLSFHEQDIKAIKSKAVAPKDYPHRTTTISFQIGLNLFSDGSGLSVPFFDTYFEKSASPEGIFYAKTRINLKNGNYIIPDAAFKLTDFESDKFYLFELHRGKDSGMRLMKQLDRHAQSMTFRKTHLKYELPINKPYSVIVLFEHESTKKALIKRMTSNGKAFQNIQQYFLCKSLESSEEGFEKGWQTLFGEERAFY